MAGAGGAGGASPPPPSSPPAVAAAADAEAHTGRRGGCQQVKTFISGRVAALASLYPASSPCWCARACVCDVVLTACPSGESLLGVELSHWWCWCSAPGGFVPACLTEFSNVLSCHLW